MYPAHTSSGFIPWCRIRSDGLDRRPSRLGRREANHRSTERV